MQKKTCILGPTVLLYAGTLMHVYAPVAQLDRVTDYESVGRGFESLPAYQGKSCHVSGGIFLVLFILQYSSFSIHLTVTGFWVNNE